jgi:hypothetical protein
VSDVYTPSYNVASDNFPSSCTSWSGGSGWSSAWGQSPSSGNDAPTLITGSSPRDTGCHVRTRGTGALTRGIDMSTLTTATLRWYAKRGSDWESGDRAYVQVSTSGCSGSFTTVFTHIPTGFSISGQNTGTTYNAFSANLDAYVGQANVCIRFLGGMTSGLSTDNFYIDTVVLESGDSGSSDGYVNGDDNSSSCGSSVRRERQLDMLTWEAAKAIEAEGVEIFVVAFGVCSSNATVYTQAQCNSQIGNTDVDNTADQRLLKCIATSFIDNDHYYYATSASGLTAIFTAIANQIAHRLIE